MDAVLVDSNVLLDIVTNDPVWGDWSSRALGRTATVDLVHLVPPLTRSLTRPPERDDSSTLLR